MRAMNFITTCDGSGTTRRSIRVPKLTGMGLFLPLLFVGCAVVFVSSYDQVTDQQIQDAAKTTEALIGDVLEAKAESAAEIAAGLREPSAGQVLAAAINKSIGFALL